VGEKFDLAYPMRQRAWFWDFEFPENFDVKFLHGYFMNFFKFE